MLGAHARVACGEVLQVGFALFVGLQLRPATGHVGAAHIGVVDDAGTPAALAFVAPAVGLHGFVEILAEIANAVALLNGAGDGVVQVLYQIDFGGACHGKNLGMHGAG